MSISLQRRTGVVLLALAPILSAAPHDTLAQGAGALRDTTLENGMQVVAVRNPVIPVATIVVALRNGAFVQSEPGQEGLPHLVEHMFFKSFAGGDVPSRAGDLDATYNGATGVETVTYYLIVPAKKADDGIKLLADAVRSPRFPKDDLEEEKRRVSNELQRNAADPFYLLSFHTNLVLWGSAFNLKNVGGHLPAVREATRDALEDHYERFYVPNNAALIVTGDISTDEIIEEAARRFGSWERGVDPFETYSHPPVPPLSRDTLVVVEAEAPDVTFRVAWQGPSIAEDREGALAAHLFGEIVTQPVSAAYRRLVDSGLFHTISLSYANSNHIGPVTLVGQTEPEKAAAAATALRAEIAMMERPDYFSDEELSLARKRQRVENAFHRESAISLALTLADRWSLIGIDAGEEEDFEVDAAAVRRFVSRYVAGRPKALALMASTHTIDTYTDALIACLDAWERR